MLDGEKIFNTAHNNFQYGANFPKEVVDAKLTNKEKFMLMEGIFADDAIFEDTRGLLFNIIRN